LISHRESRWRKRLFERLRGLSHLFRDGLDVNPKGKVGVGVPKLSLSGFGTTKAVKVRGA
jgi:hypothetical protein